jgi:hypothetical protein
MKNEVMKQIEGQITKFAEKMQFGYANIQEASGELQLAPHYPAILVMF